MKVVCIDNIFKSGTDVLILPLTIGKVYDTIVIGQVRQHLGTYYPITYAEFKIRCDDGIVRNCPVFRFTSIEVWREKNRNDKLNELGI